MKKFAIVENNKVLNIIIAESIEIAQELFPTSECIEYFDDQENKPIIGNMMFPIAEEVIPE